MTVSFMKCLLKPYNFFPDTVLFFFLRRKIFIWRWSFWKLHTLKINTFSLKQGLENIHGGCYKCSSDIWKKIRNTNFFDGNSCIVTNPYESNERIRTKSLVVKELEIGYLLKLVKNFLRQVFRNSTWWRREGLSLNMIFRAQLTKGLLPCDWLLPGTQKGKTHEWKSKPTDLWKSLGNLFFELF